MNRQYLIKKIGSPPPREKIVVADQDAYDIINRMVIKHKACACDYDQIASDFDASDIYEVCRRLWTFCKKNIAYDEETIERQNVSSPQTILSRGHCDCKGYALFIGGVLDALNRQGWNIKWKYRFASDDLFNETPGHVFVVVTDGNYEIWIDPVLAEFNQDHYFPYYQDRKVSAPARVAGCGCAAKISGGTTSESSPAGSSIAGYPVPPPAGSKIIANIAGWPAGIPHLVYTPDGRLTFEFLPAQHTPTASDMQYVLSAIQAVFNTYFNQPFNVFTYINNNGQTFAAVIQRILGQPYGFNQTFFNRLTLGAANNLFTIPYDLENQTLGSQAGIGAAIMSVFQYVPVIGQLATAFTAIVNTENAQATASQTAQTAALLKSIAPAAQQASDTYVDASGNLVDVSSGSGALTGNPLILLVAGAAILFLLLK